MNRSPEKPNTFLWIIRGLASAFLLGYVVSIFAAWFIAGIFPSGELRSDLIALGLLLLFGAAYYIMWLRHELLAGILFILWFSALWPAERMIGGDIFEDVTAPAMLLCIVGILLLVYRLGSLKREVKKMP